MRLHEALDLLLPSRETNLRSSRCGPEVRLREPQVGGATMSSCRCTFSIPCMSRSRVIIARKYTGPECGYVLR